MAQERAHWGSRLAFVLAAAGSAVGLGNIWKFPYITGINGGGLFVIIYLVCIFLVGIPILVGELFIGQQSQANLVQAFEKIHRPGSLWKVIGWMGLLSAVLIFSFYSVVGGWIVYYVFQSLTGKLLSQSPEEIKNVLTLLFASPGTQAFFHLVFTSATVLIVLAGVKNGLERANKILMPFLFLILVLLLGRASFLDGFSKAVDFLFSFHAKELTAAGVLEAVGHSFFTLSLGMGAMITYGSYLSKEENLVKSAIMVSLLDTLVALMAGLMIFSVVFTFDMQPGAGPGLIFSTIPVLLSQLPGGSFISMAFFLLILFAALTSAVSLLEVVVAYWSENHGGHRKKGTIGLGIFNIALGLLTVFSTNKLAEFKIFGLTFFDLFDKLTSNFLLPAGGLLISLFFGWILNKKACLQVTRGREMPATALLWLTRVVAPLAVFLVLLNIILK